MPEGTELIRELDRYVFSWTPDGLRRRIMGVVTPEEFGAVGDGVIDDAGPIQAALEKAGSNGSAVMLGRKTYAISQEIKVPQNVSVFGVSAPFFQNIPNDRPAPGSVTELRYVGPGGANSCVVNMSTGAVGDKLGFTDPNTTTLLGSGISNVYINGNGIAEFGLYSSRAGLGNRYDNIIASDCLKFGVWFGDLWTCSVSNVFAIFNYDRGIAIGHDTFGWAGGNIINAVTFRNLQGYANGRDGSFDKATALTSGCGVLVACARGNTFNNVVGELNNGVGIVVATVSGPNIINGAYIEGNDPTTGVGLAFVGQGGVGSGSSVNFRLNGLYTQGAQVVYLTGEPPQGVENGVLFDGLYGGGFIESDFGNYEIRRVHVVTSRDISGTLPNNNTYHNRGLATVGPAFVNIDVPHGLSVAPNIRDVNVTPFGPWGLSTQYWISNITSTTFRINVDAAPGGSGFDFVWNVASRPTLEPNPEPL